MAKPKQKRGSHTAHGNKNKNQSTSEVDPLDEGNWTMVKKQRVTILIPPLPIKVQSTTPSMGEAQPQENPRKANTKSPEENKAHLQCPTAMEPVHETEKSFFPSPQEASPPVIAVQPSEPTLSSQKLLSVSHRIASHSSPHHSVRDGTCIGISRTSKARKGLMIFADRSVLLNQRMRASYLARKLEKVGGLENWLVSLGLGCFLNVLQGKCVNKFQLANLTMNKLKDMGAYAVGPRRKLMHAIDCVLKAMCPSVHLLPACAVLWVMLVLAYHCRRNRREMSIYQVSLGRPLDLKSGEALPPFDLSGAPKMKGEDLPGSPQDSLHDGL